MTSATWVCVKCGFLQRCEITQYDIDEGIRDCPPYGCLQGLVIPGTQEDKAEWELLP